MSNDDWCFVAKSGGVTYHCRNRNLDNAKSECKKRFYDSQRLVIYDRRGIPRAIREKGAYRFKKPSLQYLKRVLVLKGIEEIEDSGDS